MEYYYFAASLPYLEFGMRAPVSYERFLSLAAEQLEGPDRRTIQRAKTGPCDDPDDPVPVLKEWKNFDVSLRNELARTRAAKKSRDPAQYIRGENYPDPFTAGFARWAAGQANPLEAEIYLDRIRWGKIEELEKGHYFDIGHLIAYALKLQILQRWDRINSVGGDEAVRILLQSRAQFAGEGLPEANPR